MRHILRRLTVYVLAIWAAVTLNFFLPRLTGGDAAQAVFQKLAARGPVSPATLQALEIQFGLNNHDPIWVQYMNYLGQLLRGNLGVSTSYYPAKVTDIIGQTLPWTIGLLLVSVVLSFVLGSFIGVFMAWKRGTAFDSILSSVMMFFYSILYPALALVAVYFLGFSLRWFPFSDGYDTSLFPNGPTFSIDFTMSVIYHAILPALTLVISTIAGWMLTMRNSMITTLSEDYILMAQAKGLSHWRVMFAYAARNAILPSVTGFAIALGSVLGGQLLVETVFNYPGVGFALFQGIQGQDYALTDGILLLVVLSTVVVNFVVDLLYAALDPRVRQERSA